MLESLPIDELRRAVVAIPVPELRELNRMGKLGDDKKERDRCEKSLIEFFIRAWSEIGEPGRPEINWHHRVIADYLEAVARGEIRDMVINQPPRTSKSSLVNILWPAWLWAQPPERHGPLMGPHVKFLSVSYGATLAEDMAVKSRRLIMGEWYQRHWGERVQIQPDQASRTNFANTAGGERMSYSIEGGILGRGGDLIIVDDPHSVKGAESEAQRRETLEGMRALSTRITDPRRSARVMVMQRLQQDDATNYAIENWRRDLVHIWFPMRYDETRPCPGDERTIDGELLWPSVWNEQSVAQEELELQEYGTAGQLQQAPIARGGGIIKREWWRLWPDDAERDVGFQAQYRCNACGWKAGRHMAGYSVECPMCGRDAERVIEYPPTSFRLLSVDTAYGDKEENSWNAATLWGLWHGENEEPRTILMEAWRGRPPLLGDNRTKGLVETIAEMATRRMVDVVLIEKKTRGPDLYRELDRLLAHDHPWTLEFFEPTGRGDKSARLVSTQSRFTRDLVWAPAKRWADMVIDETCAQPRAKFSDLSDTVSAALIWLRETNRLVLPTEHAAEVRRNMVFRGASSRFNAGEMYEGA